MMPSDQSQTSSDPEASPRTSSTLGSAGYLGAGQVARIALTMLSTIIIARILSPDDYGVLAMTAPIVGFVAMFQDFGLSAATIQAKQITQKQSNSLFWLNLFASIVLACLLILISPLVSIFYGDVRAGYVTAASALLMIASGTGVQHSALLNRDMKFKIISFIEIFSALVTFIVSLILALILDNYWALIFGSLIGAAIQTLLTWRKSSFRPSLKPSIGGANDMLRFGGHLTGFNVVNYFVRNADNVLLARNNGATELGLYDRSYKLMMLPIQSVNSPLSRLLLPILSRSVDDPVRYRRMFLLSVRGMMLATAPAIAVATALSDQMIPFLLGNEWTAAGPIFFWLGLTGLIQPVANLTGVLYLSSGRTKLMMRWGIASSIITMIAFVLAIPWGAIGMAVALFLSLALRIPLIFYFAARDVAVVQSDLWRVQIEPLVGSLIAAGLAYLLKADLVFPVNLIIFVPLSYILAILTSCISKSGRDITSQLYTIIRKLLSSLISRYVVNAN